MDTCQLNRQANYSRDTLVSLEDPMTSANPAQYQLSRLHEKLSAILTISQQMNSERDLGVLLDLVAREAFVHIFLGSCERRRFFVAVAADARAYIRD